MSEGFHYTFSITLHSTFLPHRFIKANFYYSTFKIITMWRNMVPPAKYGSLLYAKDKTLTYYIISSYAIFSNCVCSDIKDIASEIPIQTR